MEFLHASFFPLKGGVLMIPWATMRLQTVGS